MNFSINLYSLGRTFRGKSRIDVGIEQHAVFQGLTFESCSGVNPSNPEDDVAYAAIRLQDRVGHDIESDRSSRISR